jgi:hypothetical protein
VSTSTHRALIQPLREGPLDLIGDVHGEWHSLCALIAALGYDANGVHPQGRQLVFVGDLGDRGHDSPAVVDWVRGLVHGGRAQCVLGNHELTALRHEAKHENLWLRDHHPAPPHSPYRDCRHATPAERADILMFFDSLPVALQRSDLRVVHAEWNPIAIGQLQGFAGSALQAFQHFEAVVSASLRDSGVDAAAEAEEAAHAAAIERADVEPPLLRSLGARDELRQRGNPLRVLTSGQERLAPRPFFASGKWRMSERVNWWDEYEESTPVVIGHYWRSVVAVHKGHREPFGDHPYDAWVGKQRNVFCVDYSIGKRYRLRSHQASTCSGRLGAMRWPERQVVIGPDV